MVRYAVRSMLTSMPSLALLPLFFLLCARPAGAEVLYEQPWTPGGAQGSSQGVYTTYDDFILEADSRITNVGWAGFSNGQQPLDSGPYTVSFYLDSGAAPGALLSSVQIAVENLEITPINHFAAWSVYNMSGDLATPFVATAGSRYWLSVYDSTLSPFFAWEGSSRANNLAYMKDTRSGGGLWALEADFTMKLTGERVTQAVPEPGSLPLLLGALPVIIRFRRRRR